MRRQGLPGQGLGNPQPAIGHMGTSSCCTLPQLPLPAIPISFPFLKYTIKVPAFAQTVLSSGGSLSLLIATSLPRPIPVISSSLGLQKSQSLILSPYLSALVFQILLGFFYPIMSLLGGLPLTWALSTLQRQISWVPQFGPWCSVHSQILSTSTNLYHPAATPPPPPPLPCNQAWGSRKAPRTRALDEGNAYARPSAIAPDQSSPTPKITLGDPGPNTHPIPLRLHSKLALSSANNPLPA